MGVVVLIIICCCIFNSLGSDSNSNEAKSTSGNNSSKSNNSNNSDKIHSKVVGVTVGDRQELIRKYCYPNKELTLKREPYNEYDKNAISVYVNSNQLGYIKKELAQDLAPRMDRGEEFKVSISNVTGGDSYNYGINITIVKKENKTQTTVSNNTSSNYKNTYVSSYDDDSDNNDHSYKSYNDDDDDGCYYYDVDDDYRSYNDDCDANPDMCCGYDH